MEQLSGQITVAVAGTAVAGTDIRGTAFWIKAKPTNVGNGYVGNDGADDIDATNSFVLAPGELIPIEITNLNRLRFDVATGGDGFCWLKSRA